MSTVQLLTHKGTTDTIKGWSKKTGINHACLYQRIQDGWSHSRALTTPVRQRAQNVRPRKPKQAAIATQTASVAFPPFAELKRQHLATQRQFNSLLRQFNRDLHALMGRGVGLVHLETTNDRTTPVTRGLS